MFRTIQKLLFAVGLLAASTTYSIACPFCSAVSQTLTEQIDSADVAVLAELIDLPPKFEDGPEQPLFDEAIEASKATFRIVTVYRGEDELGKIKEFKALYLSEKEPGEKFLVLGRKQPEIEWGAPIWTSSRVQEYLKTVLQLPNGKEKAHERLAFFEDYLQDEESLLRADSFDEFARADYDVLKKLKGRINRTRLLEWIVDPEVTRARRRLYFTMLGVCGTDEDVKFLEKMLRSEKETDWQALDALVACYLTLAGEAGLPLIEEQFLKKQDLEYVPLFAVTMALRFHGEQASVIPRKRIIEAMRFVLDREDLADLVITDLARWNDWGSMDRLAKLFYDVDEETFFIRMAVVKYMRVCPLPGAKIHLAKFAKVDPKVVERATMTWPGLTPVKPVPAKPVPAKPTPEKPAPEKPASDDESQPIKPITVDPITAEPTAADNTVAAAKASEAETNTAAVEGSDSDMSGSDGSDSDSSDADATAVPVTKVAVTSPPSEAPIAPAEASTARLRMIILAVAAGCVFLLLVAFKLILKGRIEPAA